MKKHINMIMILALLAFLNGCVSNGSSSYIPQPTMSRDNPYATAGIDSNVSPLYLDYVTLGNPVELSSHVISTPVEIGITASNSCARITGKNWSRRGDGFNIILNVKEGAHFGYKCDKTRSRLQTSIMLPYNLYHERPYAFKIIVNDRPLGVIETRTRNLFQSPNGSATQY